MPELADILRRYGPDYIKKFGAAMLPSHRRALDDIVRCQTAALGGSVYQCDNCGEKHFSYHSCRNRACPKCHKTTTQAWLEKRRGELLPVPYFHVVFTLPQQSRPIVRSNQKPLYGVLMKAAAHSLIELAADKRHVGGLVGVMAVLHTWSRTLGYHPHVHCLVPAGGLSPDRRHWMSANKKFLVPVKALSRLFRGKFMAMAKKELPDVPWPPSVWKKDWVVHCKPAVQGPDNVLKYLARYLHRIAITNNRIVSIDEGKVTFRYQDTKSGQCKTMTLEALEFIRRFLQHVPPKGAHKVRYYGLWNPVHRLYLRLLQLLLAPYAPPGPPPPPYVLAELQDQPKTHPLAGAKCPHCGQGVLILIAVLGRYRGIPP